MADSHDEMHLMLERKARRADRFDEVWDEVYVMNPLPNDEHQELVHRLSFSLQEVVGWSSQTKVRPGVNVSDRDIDWQKNYRCPDVVVFLPASRAINRGTHWFGGPDFAVEIVSPGDRARQKLEFYARVKVQELLLIDRAPWRLELYRLAGSELVEVGVSSISDPLLLMAETLSLTFRLVPSSAPSKARIPERPLIEVATVPAGRLWLL